MRIRTIKPEFYLHAELFTAERETGLPLRIAYTGLWGAADREGRFKWRPMTLGVTILPFDGIEFSRVLDALWTRGFLVKYRVGNEWYGAIPSFSKHQVINNRERKSEIPDISTADEVAIADLTRQPRVDHAGKAEGKGKEGNMEGKGKEGKGVQGKTPRTKLTDDEWLSTVRTDPAYEGIDVMKEHGKMIFWCANKHKQPTRGRFLAWLNRIEKPMSGATRKPESNMVQETLIARTL